MKLLTIFSFYPSNIFDEVTQWETFKIDFMVRFCWNMWSDVQQIDSYFSFSLSHWQTYKRKCMSFFSMCTVLSIFFYLLLSDKVILHTLHVMEEKKKKKAWKQWPDIYYLITVLISDYTWWLLFSFNILFWSLGWKYSLFQMQKRLSYSGIYNPFLSC